MNIFLGWGNFRPAVIPGQIILLVCQTAVDITAILVTIKQAHDILGFRIVGESSLKQWPGYRIIFHPIFVFVIFWLRTSGTQERSIHKVLIKMQVVARANLFLGYCQQIPQAHLFPFCLINWFDGEILFQGMIKICIPVQGQQG